MNFIEFLQKEFATRNLCLAGGISLNAELNSQLLYSGKLQNLFVQPVAHDGGLALGGALYYAYKMREWVPQKLEHLYWGPRYSNSKIRRVLERNAIKFKFCKNIHRKIAQALTQDKIVAVFYGEMEYGPRALGHRSILTSAQNSLLKNKINKWIKNREDFQPFAPSVLEEELSKYFILPQTTTDLRYMIVNLRARPESFREIPAVLHVNGTSRVQIVNETTAPYLYKILKYYQEYSGCGVLLNTSFNLKGRPIVENPQDALEVFFSTPIDCLALGNYWIEKN